MKQRSVCCGKCDGVIWEDVSMIPSARFEISFASDGPTTITIGDTGEVVHECPPKRVGISMTGGTLRAAGMTILRDVAIEAVDCDVDVEGLGLE